MALVLCERCGIHRGIVGVSTLVATIEGLRIRFVERQVTLEACDQVWIGKKWHAKRNQIGGTTSNRGSGSCFAVAIVGNARAAKPLPKLAIVWQRRQDP